MKFLVIRFSSLGDIITTTAFLHALREKHPGAEIHYVTKREFSELITNQPFVDKIYPLEKDQSVLDLAKSIKEEFDCVFDLHKNPRSILLSMLIKKKRLKRVNKHTLYRWKLLHPHLLFFIRNRETRYNIDDQLKLINADLSHKPNLEVKKRSLNLKRPIVGVAPGAHWDTKRWPEEYFARLIEMLTNKGFSIVVFGSKEEKEIAEKTIGNHTDILNLIGKLSILETIEHMKDCDIIVSNDSAAMHMAVAIDVPVVAIFGPTVREFGFFPKSKASIVIENENLKCRPCSLHGTNRCPLGHHKCMRDIKPETVLKAVEKLLEDRDGAR